MKWISIIIFLAFSSLLFSQAPYKYYFSALKGLEDNKGKTHLFYTKYEAFKNKAYPEDNTNVTIFDFATSSGTDKPFLYGGYSCSLPYCSGRTVLDFEFWNNDPSKYISCGFSLGMDPSPFIERYDGKRLTSPGWLSVSNIEISRQNDSILYYSSNGWLYKSTNLGNQWTRLNDNFELVSLCPYNDKIVFGLTREGFLIKSLNGGLASTTVDTVKTNSRSADLYKFAYDKDTSYIYRIVNNSLYVSDRSGDSLSWKLKFSGKGTLFLHELFLSADSKRAGRLYLAADKNIFISEDHANSFKFFNKVGRNIIGIYAKPGSDVVYAETSYEIYEVTPDTVKIIKQIPPPASLLNYYPLAKGNKWIYRETVTDYPSTYIMTREVLGDTVMPDKNKYFIIKEYHSFNLYKTRTHYEREDSLTSRIYAYDTSSKLENKALLIDDLTAALGDTVHSYRFYVPVPRVPDLSFIWYIFYSEDQVNLFGQHLGSKKFYNQVYPVSFKYELTEGFGLSKIFFTYDLGYTLDSLVSCTINGIKYGDTLYVGVKNTVSIPLNYSLRQNYPNPFNPETNIEFSIIESGFVTLKVYNSIGQEVATLVNSVIPKGSYKVNFNGSQLPSGVYIYSIKAGTYIETRKMLLLK